MIGKLGVFLTVFLFAASVSAAELIMFESAGCPWCKKWNEEIGVRYDKSEEARILPLRRLRMEEPRPPELMNLPRVVFSPTFVVVERGFEVGRIQGYPGEENFWWMLGNLIKRLDRMQRTGFPPAPPPPPVVIQDGMAGMSSATAPALILAPAP
jgi:thioredoxin-related protein